MSNYKDLKNNPRLKQIYLSRIQIIKHVRDFFHNKNYLEVDTPIAIILPGQEPYLNPIPIKITNPIDIEQKMYLQTSPEFAMKKLIASGMDKIFQICKCFRNNESWGGIHNTEFTMIEWYKKAELENIMNETEELFKYVAKRIGKTKCSYKNIEVDIEQKWAKISVKQLFKKYLNVNLDEILTKKSIQSFAKQKEIKINEKYSYDDIFYLIFLNHIEPNLGVKTPTFVYDYPAQLCSLSKLSSDKNYAQRTELYICGLEIANAFGELIDSEKQKNNLLIDQEKRKQLNKDIYDIDNEFIDSLKYIEEDLSGIALGIDRMILLFNDTDEINEVIFQSINDQIKK